MYLETLLLTSSIRSITKGFISRNRPYVYYPDAPMEKKLDVEAKRSGDLVLVGALVGGFLLARLGHGAAAQPRAANPAALDVGERRRRPW